ncbi:unnamed protein product [Penicillium nalgiovense]|uniref:Transcription factor domain-containing protein n=1 Tax=Penicillium nalgiovense TaxID=60175 RepID=A0A9W4IAD6_PENNA|nr:unnamed protein product [Penicillium nalgiovense]CAG7966304.1 unnamed protein product [Penicillium nalgiovense]CAG7999034.1 unnamed protein product [Penicillium nalgiovense]CAG8039512.1 unnamed protein product [Penicillium nalgiovense]CAG8040652.1 unnamed protein product [Penicillium nalgiovense]
MHDNLQNPSDALLILAHSAGQPDVQEERTIDDDARVSQHSHAGGVSPRGTAGQGQDGNTGICRKTSSISTTYLSDHDKGSYYLLRNKIITLPLLMDLLRLQVNPSGNPRALGTIADLECNKRVFPDHCILVIALQDCPDLTDLYRATWDYLRQQILDIVLGVATTRRICCVEGLLLLGEWNLINYGQTQADDGGEAAWSILGVAVRLAYRLRLEDSGFEEKNEELDPASQRKRLASTYRQISIRMGQAFWCRGPGLSRRFTAQDFPSLQPNHANDEDLASWIQAQVELTTLFGNAHDILFASKSHTVKLITRGDYVKYIDDTSLAMTAWEHSWQSLAVSKHLKSFLTLMKDYLRLYVNAFAFQAVIYRASRASPEKGDVGGPGLDFPNSTMAIADARHIYEALDAAESLLKTFAEDFDPEKHLRYMPTRFYLQIPTLLNHTWLDKGN